MRYSESRLAQHAGAWYFVPCGDEIRGCNTYRGAVGVAKHCGAFGLWRVKGRVLT